MVGPWLDSGIPTWKPAKAALKQAMPRRQVHEDLSSMCPESCGASPLRGGPGHSVVAVITVIATPMRRLLSRVRQLLTAL